MNWMLRATGKRVMNTILKQFNPITLLAIVLVGAFAFVVGKQQSPDPNDEYLKEIAQWKAQAQVASARLDSALKAVDDIRKINVVLQEDNQDKLNQAANLKVSVARTRKELDRVRDSIRTAGIEDNCKPIAQLAEGYRAEADSVKKIIGITESVLVNKDIEIGNLNVALKGLEDKAKELQQKVDQIPPPKSKKKFLGFIPQPSRVVSFLGGVAVTLGGVIAVSR